PYRKPSHTPGEAASRSQDTPTPRPRPSSHYPSTYFRVNSTREAAGNVAESGDQLLETALMLLKESADVFPSPLKIAVDGLVTSLGLRDVSFLPHTLGPF